MSRVESAVAIGYATFDLLRELFGSGDAAHPVDEIIGITESIVVYYQSRIDELFNYAS